MSGPYIAAMLCAGAMPFFGFLWFVNKCYPDGTQRWGHEQQYIAKQKSVARCRTIFAVAILICAAVVFATGIFSK